MIYGYFFSKSLNPSSKLSLKGIILPGRLRSELCALGRYLRQSLEFYRLKSGLFWIFSGRNLVVIGSVISYDLWLSNSELFLIPNPSKRYMIGQFGPLSIESALDWSPPLVWTRSTVFEIMSSENVLNGKFEW